MIDVADIQSRLATLIVDAQALRDRVGGEAALIGHTAHLRLLAAQHAFSRVAEADDKAAKDSE